jgi:pimeloyl-ACP methyl ester carboxylesterase
VTSVFLSALSLALDAPAPDAPPAANGADSHWLLALIIAGTVAVVILVLCVLAKYLRLAVNLFLDTPLPITANLNDFTPPTGEIVQFPSMEGRSLRGMFIDRPTGAPERGVVIFCHEFASDMLSAGRYAWPLIQAGYAVFTFDFRGHGQSFTPPHFEPRHWPSDHEVNDILAAIAYVESRCPWVESTGLGILGISRGASAAVIAAALNADVRCLAVDGVFSTDQSIDELMKRWVQIFAHVDLARADRSLYIYRIFRALTMFYVELKCRCRFPSTRRALGKLDNVPLLFIHGARDAYIRPEWVQTLYKGKRGPKELWLCPDAKHNQAVITDAATYSARLTEFFAAHLGPPAGEGCPPAATGRAAP